MPTGYVPVTSKFKSAHRVNLSSEVRRRASLLTHRVNGLLQPVT
jgi:hypothetical protein